MTLRWFDAMKVEGKPKLEGYDKLPYLRLLSEFGDGEELQISVRKRKRTRSAKANAYYWAVVVTTMARELGYADKDELHDALVSKFRPLPADPVTGLMRRESTREMSTDEFASYASEVRMWAEADLGFHFPEHEIDS